MDEEGFGAKSAVLLSRLLVKDSSGFLVTTYIDTPTAKELASHVIKM